jgi:nitrite reductase (cytochrome c-552)
MASQFQGNEMSDTNKNNGSKKLAWMGWGLVVILMIVVAVLGLFIASIMERRHEAAYVTQIITPIADMEPDSMKWGLDFPREYDTWKQTEISGMEKYDYLKNDPRLKELFAGYSFAAEYNQARGHMHAIEDVTSTARVDPKRGGKAQPGTCMTCKSPDVPVLMKEMGVAEFYKTPFDVIKTKVSHPIGCADCHDAKTMNLKITRPALREAFAAMGKDIDKASYQEMRSLVCAQCHVEYYFRKKNPADAKETYLTFPWKLGLNIDDIEKYYTTEDRHIDWVHPVSKTEMIKMQHPDYEIYTTSVHYFRGVACADCHMPYKSEGGVKFTDHNIQSPLNDISNSCGVCHRWSEAEVTERVESIQKKERQLLDITEDALAAAHKDVGDAMAAGATDAQLKDARELIRRAQMRWDFAAANNGMGFHSPQESARILATAVDLAQQARLLVAKLKKG